MLSRALAGALTSGAFGIVEGTAFAADSLPGLIAKAPRFPVSINRDRRQLVDAADQPMLVHGDTAWSLIAQLSLPEIEHYLRNRAGYGFNALIVELIEHRFASRAPNTIDGIAPFLEPGNFATPNRDYFDRAAVVLDRAAAMGFLVFLTPAYIGASGGADGWYQEMVRAGPETLEAYGRYIGERFGYLQNVVWMHGGDYNPPDPELVRAIARGIGVTAPHMLHTAHCAPETSAHVLYGEDPWLKLDTVYTYKPVAPSIERHWQRIDDRPYVMIESAYEYEHKATEQRLRTQAYQAVLGGAAGHFFGNNPIWHFGAGGLFTSPVTWQAALDDRGTQSMAVLRRAMERVGWWRLRPDFEHRFVTGGFGSGADAVGAAVATDGRSAAVYVPTSRRLRLDLRALASQRLALTWIDPSDGTLMRDGTAAIDGGGIISLGRRGRNRFGDGDWLLLVEAA